MQAAQGARGGPPGAAQPQEEPEKLVCTKETYTAPNIPRKM